MENLACVLPCGALDLIRIVHLNGNVECPVTAGEVLKSNPNHVLSTPSSQGVVGRILILSPNSELKRGSIYFLIPSSSLAQKKKPHKNPKNSSKCPEKSDNDDETFTSEKNRHVGIAGPGGVEYGSLVLKAFMKTNVFFSGIPES